MTHEPECPYVQPSIRGEIVDASTCGWCDVARAAYQRGREDAAEAVEALESEREFRRFVGCGCCANKMCATHPGNEYPCDLGDDEDWSCEPVDHHATAIAIAAAAARGDGEQA